MEVPGSDVSSVKVSWRGEDVPGEGGQGDQRSIQPLEQCHRPQLHWQEIWSCSHWYQIWEEVSGAELGKSAWNLFIFCRELCPKAFNPWTRVFYKYSHTATTKYSLKIFSTVDHMETMNHSTDLVECWLILTILCMVEMFTWTMKRTGWCSLHSGLEELTSDWSLLMRLVTLWVCLTPGDHHCYDCKGGMSCGGVVTKMINYCFLCNLWSDSGALMFPTIDDHKVYDVKLGQGDMQAIQQLYGPRTRKQSGNNIS